MMVCVSQRTSDVDWSEWKCAVASHLFVLSNKPQTVLSVADGLLKHHPLSNRCVHLQEIIQMK